MTVHPQIVPTYCSRCDNPIFPALRKVFFSEPYPRALDEAVKRLPKGSVPIAAHFVTKQITNRHGHIIDYDPDPILDHVVTWDGKTYGQNGFCGPCVIQLQDEAAAHEAEFRQAMDRKDAGRRRLWHGLPRYKRALSLIRHDHIREWYSRQRKAGQLAYWWVLDRSIPASQDQEQQPAGSEKQANHAPQAAE